MKYTTHYELNKPENSDQFNVEHFNENATKIDNTLYALDQAVSPMSSHITNQNNPHNVTKAQVGLSNVDNTSDLNKPISTAVQSALENKADTSSLGTAAYKNVATSGDASASQVVLGNDSRLSDSRPASDVSSWAKASTKPTYTASEVGAIASTEKGANNGVAELDSSGKVPSSQLPSYVDDVLEYASTSVFPSTGESGKIYVALDTNKTYRWSGSDYVEISESLALGETSSTAYRGDRGKAAYDHSQLTSGNPHNVTASDVGLGNVGNFKAVSTEASQGLTDTEKANARANIGAGSSSLALGETSSDAYRGDRGKTAYDHATDSDRLTIAKTSGLYKIATTGEGHIASVAAVEKSDITALGIPGSDTTYNTVSTTENGLAPKITNSSGYLKGDGTWDTPPGTTYSVVSKTADGLAPQLPNETTTTKYLRQDGSWEVPPDTNTWRGIQDNLTSTSTTDSLSANQGKVLKTLADSMAKRFYSSWTYKIEITTSTGSGQLIWVMTPAGYITFCTSGSKINAPNTKHMTNIGKWTYSTSGLVCTLNCTDHTPALVFASDNNISVTFTDTSTPQGTALSNNWALSSDITNMQEQYYQTSEPSPGKVGAVWIG